MGQQYQGDKLAEAANLDAHIHHREGTTGLSGAQGCQGAGDRETPESETRETALAL